MTTPESCEAVMARAITRTRFSEKSAGIVKRQIAALRAAGWVIERDWHGIESAPKDGKPVWLRGDGIYHGVEFVGHWHTPKYAFIEESWVTTNGTSEVPERCLTHWKPRPEPPAEQSGKENAK